MDSTFGATHGLPISFDQFTRDAILKFAQTRGDLLEGSNVAKELLNVCQK